MMYSISWQEMLKEATVKKKQKMKRGKNTPFVAFIKKEFLHVMRDKKTLLMLFGLPIVQIILFGFALSNEVKNAQIVILDNAKDYASQQIINKFEASNEFVISKSILDKNDIDKIFKKGNVKMAVVIPVNFYHNLMHLHTAQIQLITDASDPNLATTISGYAKRIVGEYQQKILSNYKQQITIHTKLRTIYNPNLKAAVNFVPGVISLVLLLVCVLMTSVSIVKEKEIGTMEVLLVSPLNPYLVIISKSVPYIILSLIDLTIILLLSVFVLGVPIAGSVLLLYTISTLFIIVGILLGLLISNSTQSQQAAMLFALMGMLIPTLLFTGFLFPLENMPYALQVFANIVPSKWYYIIVKNIMIKGLGIASIWQPTLILFGMAIILSVVNIKKFKIRLG